MIQRIEIWHAEYNLQHKDTLRELPEEKAIFGVFGIVNDEPANCRYIGETDSLHTAIKDLFREPANEGLKKFFQGPWIKMLQFELLPESSRENRLELVKDWETKYIPKIDEEGEYPGYYTD
ncbi:hypothetical protein [Chitinophaga sp. OAE865]|uniref:hypothetical protein n=1 Tax=Chitinophaga sp. OAE865 TaxID=2817898 RepID=UPI001AE60F1F